MKKALLFLAVFLYACSENPTDKDTTGPPDGTVFSESFVWTYMMPDNISGEAYALNSRYLHIQFDGQKVDQWGDKESYVQLCDKYNDVSYNDNIVPNSTIALAKDYTAINVVCNKDIDADHKAGASLNDIIKICAVSYDDFIASGYDPLFRPVEDPAEFAVLSLPDGKGTSPLFKLLSQLDDDDMRLIEPEIFLYFTKPLANDLYEFTITLVTAEGSTPFKIVADIK